MAAEPCCFGSCRYTPGRVGFWRRNLGRLAELAEYPRPGLHQLGHDPNDGRPCADSGGRCRGAGESDISGDLIAVKADIEMALRAGCRTDEEIAAYLCPFALEDGVIAQKMGKAKREG